jgi:hypothetical protein
MKTCREFEDLLKCTVLDNMVLKTQLSESIRRAGY